MSSCRGNGGVAIEEMENRCRGNWGVAVQEE